jgi:predicted N-acyltransferase
MVLQRAQYATVSLMSEDQASRLAESRYRWKKDLQCEDAVIELPDTLDAYLAGLGRQARKHLPYYARRLRREWGKSFECSYLHGLDITADAFSRLVGLNRMRMERRGSKHLWTPSKVRNRWQLAQETGLLVSLRHHGEIIGGTLSYLHDGEAYLVLIGHLPVYDRLNIGNVCLYQTVSHLIELGVKRFHLLWGQSLLQEAIRRPGKELLRNHRLSDTSPSPSVLLAQVSSSRAAVAAQMDRAGIRPRCEAGDSPPASPSFKQI